MERNSADVHEVLDRVAIGHTRATEHERAELVALVQHSSTMEVDR